MGEISNELRNGLQGFIFALVSRDARACVEAMQRLGVLLPIVDTVELERAIAAMFERFGGVGVADLVQTDPQELKELAIRFSDLIRTLPFQLPEDFLLLFRSISLISGVTSALNRDFNMWDAVDPFARSLLNVGGSSTLKALGREATALATTMLGLPRKMDSVLTRLDQGVLSIRVPEVEKGLRRLDGSARRITSSILFSVLLISGVALRIYGDDIGTILMVASVPFLIHAIGFLRLK